MFVQFRYLHSVTIIRTIIYRPINTEEGIQCYLDTLFFYCRPLFILQSCKKNHMGGGYIFFPRIPFTFIISSYAL